MAGRAGGNALTRWLQLSVVVADYQAGAVESLLEQAGCLAVTLTDKSGQPILEPAPGDNPLWRRLAVTGLFDGDVDSDALMATLTRQLPIGCEARLFPLDDQDWIHAWRMDYRPMRFGKRLWICPTDATIDDSASTVIKLDPGLAFGTGTHPSTALCLEWLDGLDLADLSVIDYGCGSGVLAIAAARLGAREVHATDIDPQALLATGENAARNSVADKLRITLPTELTTAPADILLANILAGPLMQLASDLAALVRPGGRIALAGLLQGQAGAVAETYRSWFRLFPSASREGWVRLDGRRLGSEQGP